MKLSANLLGLDQIMRGLKNFAGSVASPAVGAAADALAHTIEDTQRAENLEAPFDRTGEGARREIGASDPISVACEFGTLEQDASPWLEPSLPAAKRPMRAAVVTAVARAISQLRLDIR